MRIVIDMQGVQSTNSRNRGIGRYAHAFVEALVRNRGEHEIVLALSGLFPETVWPTREAFEGLLPAENIRVWHAAGPVAYVEEGNDWRRQAGQICFESFLCSLEPDFIYVTSLFEGFGDDAITSIQGLPHGIPIAVTLYDLIPYINSDFYLRNEKFKCWYLERIEHLRRADLWLAISESSRREGIDFLDLPADRSINVGCDANPHFRNVSIAADLQSALRGRYGLIKPFVLYTGGIDHRKNIEGLIRAYACLPEMVRQEHQLAIVCSISSASRSDLESLAHRQGLRKNEVVLTGFVPDDDLLALYNLCKLFVFPSWHEGFGLPALEAMRCGAPVIGANSSSLPEVIGCIEALFNPHSDSSIAETMQRGLTDLSYRDRLIKNGLEQSKRFSWDKSAEQTIRAIELYLKDKKSSPQGFAGRLKLAYVSPLPPMRTGIADYSAELLPELRNFYDIDIIVDGEVASGSQFDGMPLRTPNWFLENCRKYDRVLYHFGNSSFHRYMFPLLDLVPGVVVLHDFYLSGVVAEMDVQGWLPGCWSQSLYEGHGYVGLKARHKRQDSADVVWEFPCSLGVIQKSSGLIVHSAHSKNLARQWYGGGDDDWVEIPLLRVASKESDRASVRRALGIGDDDYLVCAFGLLGPTKLNLQLLRAWSASSLAEDSDCHLVFVGENPVGQYGAEVSRFIRSLNPKANVRITGWADAETFRQYLVAADVGVQLRTLSRGETSASVLDCMNYGKAVIVNANGSMVDIDSEAVWKLPDEFTREQLIEALETLRSDKILRARMGRAARAVILNRHSPELCARQYRDAIESLNAKAVSHPGVLAWDIINGVGWADEGQLHQAAAAVVKNTRPRNAKRQLFVDVSELIQRDAKSGIQRVVRNLLKEWLENPPEGFRVEPVYATAKQPYFYARRFAAKMMDFDDAWLQDAPIDYGRGDVFLGLDLQPQVVVEQRLFYQQLRLQGVRVKFVVYDLLCVLMPQYFVVGAADHFGQWLEVVSECDGAVCISKAVADDLSWWVAEKRPERSRRFEINWFHLGADVQISLDSRGEPDNAGALLKTLSSKQAFLMVGTVEPRKGHAQVLDAFESLWHGGHDVILVIVGKKGWLVDALASRLKVHSELGLRLFWLEGVSDEYLEKIYAACAGLIAASYGEGFGLPLIEAARHGIPIIARDIPVFREVAGRYAYYFSGGNGADLANEIELWMEKKKIGNIPASSDMPFLTWAQSASQLVGVI